MADAASSPTKKYQSQYISTASPEKCVVLLYERLVDDVEFADATFEGRDFKPAFDALFHAQSIVRLLRSAMRTDLWPGGANLVALYNWFEKRLSDAAMFQDRQALQECIPLIRRLNEAWKTAAGQVMGAREDAIADPAVAARAKHAFAETRVRIADFLA